VAGLVDNRGCPKEADLSWLQKDNNIAFEFGKSSLTSESYAFLDKVVLFLKEQPQINLSIQGHTDNRGSAIFNQKLSEIRAKTCFDYLIGKGINVERLDYKGFGESQPISDNTTEAGRSQNRRAAFIEIILNK
jgi:OmpA-OmpF porin, OOP family